VPQLRPFVTPIERVYAEQLFHGPSLAAIETIEGTSESGMVLRLATERARGQVLPGPAFADSLDPLVLDGVFQALIVWCREHLGVPSLPSRIAALRVFGNLTGPSARAVVRISTVEGMIVSSDVDLLDNTGNVCVRLEGYLCTGSASLHRAFSPEPALASVLPSPPA
jgi:hypothetical protein